MHQRLAASLWYAYWSFFDKLLLTNFNIVKTFDLEPQRSRNRLLSSTELSRQFNPR